MYIRPKHALPVLRAALLPALILLAGPAPAQGDDMRLPVVVDAESTDYDGNASMLHFRGLKLTQGSISIESDEARSAGRDFDDNTWHLSGNVIFDVAEGHIEADSATLTFTDYQLQVATIEGTPATFELRRPGSDETTHASARRLHYDVADGIIEFTGKAEISEGANRFAAESLVYNIRERRVNAASSGAPEDRVKVIFTPPAADEADDGRESGESAGADPAGGDANDTAPDRDGDE